MALAPNLAKGGAERVLSLLLQHMDRRRFHLELALFKPEIEYSVPSDVKVHLLSERPPASQPCPIRLGNQAVRGWEKELGWISATAAKVSDLVSERRPDVVLSSPIWACMMAGIAGELFPSSVRVVHRIDAPPSVALAGAREHELFRRLIRAYYPCADLLVAVSRGVKADLVTNFGVDPSLVHVIHNPANTELIDVLARQPVYESQLLDGLPIIVFVGRLERVKGLEYLLRAAAGLLDKRAFHVVLVGEGSQQGYLHSLAMHLGITDSVHFLGQQENPFKYMSRATMLVLPSLSEGMSNVLVEAMACGCPVIATDIDGGTTLDILGPDEPCGLIVPVADTDALRLAIDRMLASEELRHSLAARGLTRVRQFGLAAIVEEYECAVEQAAGLPDRRHHEVAAPTVPWLPSTVSPAGSREMRMTGDHEPKTQRSDRYSDWLRTALGAAWRGVRPGRSGQSEVEGAAHQVACTPSFGPAASRAGAVTRAQPLLEPYFVCVRGALDDGSAATLDAALQRALGSADFGVVMVAEDGSLSGLTGPDGIEILPEGDVSLLSDEELLYAVALVHAVAVQPKTAPPVVVRALSVGCPVVCTRGVESVDTRIEDQGIGLLVPPSDADAAAEAMLQLLWNSDLRNTMARRATTASQTQTMGPDHGQSVTPGFGRPSSRASEQNG